jgi:signal transduction histidine kinase
VVNLAINARDAMPGGGRLTIAAGTSASEAVLTVADTGTGMDAATLQRACEPFFTTKAPGAGAGLGLSTVYEIVDAAGGRLTIDSALGEGTEITVRLPLLPEHDRDPWPWMRVCDRDPGALEA